MYFYKNWSEDHVYQSLFIIGITFYIILAVFHLLLQTRIQLELPISLEYF